MPHFLASRFLRHLSPAPLQAYLTAQEISVDGIDWTASATRRAEAVMAHLASLPSAEREQVEADFQEIDRLANDLGVRAIIEEADRMGIVLGPTFTALHSNHDRAMHTWVAHNRIWRMSRRLAETEAVANTRHWHERAHVPAGTVKTGADDCARFGAALSVLFSKQLRGQQYRVEPVRRPDGSWYFYAILNDLPVSTESFVPGGNETRVSVTDRIFEVIACVPPSGGTLACYVQGGADRDLRESLFAACAQEILGVALVPLPRNHPKEVRWELDHLLRRKTLPVDASTGVEEAAVRALWVTANGQGQRKGMFEADPTKGPEDIYNQLDTWLDQTQVPLASLHVYRAKLSLYWPARGKRRPTLSWTVGKPGTCTLKSEREDRRRIGEAHQRLWRIDATGSAVRAPDTRPAA